MPSWVLLLTPDSLGAAELEQEIRLAGYSPRRAPDVPRAEVLLGQGDEPAAVVIDLAAAGEETLGMITRLTSASRIVALAPDGDGPLARTADESGAHVLARLDAKRGQLSALLERVTKGRS
ncbi:MAG: hypothetical protein OEQ13_14625 [Acidobacteriota bacterium]|nr:hypothetical protein [Acidobacteriota bacterium]